MSGAWKLNRYINIIESTLTHTQLIIIQAPFKLPAAFKLQPSTVIDVGAMAASRSEQPDEDVHHTALQARQKALRHHIMPQKAIPTSVSRSSICLSKTSCVHPETIRAPEVINVPFEDVMRSPEQFAWKLSEFDIERFECIALQIWLLEQAWRVTIARCCWRFSWITSNPDNREQRLHAMLDLLFFLFF